MDHCTAIKHNGKPCTRARVEGTLCTQHFKLSGQPRVEPWTQLGLPEPSPLLRPAALRRLRAKLNARRRSGGAGSIYIYTIDGDEPGFWKIGMTERTADVRLAEWTRVHGKKHTIRLVAEHRVDHSHKWIERVVHLYLDYCRVNRYAQPDDDGTFYSEWYASGKPLPGQRSDPLKQGIAKQVEWFYGADMDLILHALVADRLAALPARR